jgi:quercetin dioxygenase-like cupin family protein
MSTILRKPALAVVAAAIVLMSPASSVQAQTGLERKVLLQQDLDIPGYETLLVAVTIAVGGREGRHTHAATLVGQVLEGELTLEQEGLPTRTYRAGDSIMIKPGQIHEGINTGKTPIRALVTFIAEKGKPLTTQVR